MLTRKNKLDKNKTVGVFQTNQKALCKNYCLMIYNGCSFLNYENEAISFNNWYIHQSLKGTKNNRANSKRNYIIL